MNVERVQRIENVAGIQDRAIPARDERELRHLGVHELAETREQLHGLDREHARFDPLGDAVLELTEVRLEVTR